MHIPVITIESLCCNPESGIANYQNKLLVTDRIHDTSRLRSCCKFNTSVILICTGGEMVCTINLRQYRIEKNSLLMLFPQDVFRIDSVSSELESYTVMATNEFLCDLQIDVSNRPDFFISTRESPVFTFPQKDLHYMLPFYSLFSAFIQQSNPEVPKIIKGLMQAFSFALISLIKTYQESSSLLGNFCNKHLFTRFNALVKAHHKRERIVKFYADALNITPNYLSAAIKEYSGKTAAQWINEYVILEAKMMLKESTLSIQEISKKLNFPSQSAFGKYFKQQLGKGPREYRNSPT